METREHKTTEKTVNLPSFTMSDVITVIALLGVIALLITSNDVPEYLLVIVSLGIGIKVEPSSSKVK